MGWALEDLTPELRVRLTRAARRAYEAERTAVSVHDVVHALASDIDEATSPSVTGSRRPTLPFAKETDLALERCAQERKDGKVTVWQLAVALTDYHLAPSDADILARIIERGPVPEQETWETTIGEVQRAGSAMPRRDGRRSE